MFQGMESAYSGDSLLEGLSLLSKDLKHNDSSQPPPALLVSLTFWAASDNAVRAAAMQRMSELGLQTFTLGEECLVISADPPQHQQQEQQPTAPAQPANAGAPAAAPNKQHGAQPVVGRKLLLGAAPCSTTCSPLNAGRFAQHPDSCPLVQGSSIEPLYNEPGHYTLLLMPEMHNTKLPRLQLVTTIYLGRESEGTLCIKLQDCSFCMGSVDLSINNLYLCPFALDTAVLQLGLRTGGKPVPVEQPDGAPQLLSKIRFEHSYVKRFVTFWVDLAPMHRGLQREGSCMSRLGRSNSPALSSSCMLVSLSPLLLLLAAFRTVRLTRSKPSIPKLEWQ